MTIETIRTILATYDDALADQRWGDAQRYYVAGATSQNPARHHIKGGD